MAGQSTNIKIEPTLKKQAQQLFADLGLDLGLDMTTAVNIFLRQAVKEHAIPFRIGDPAPNSETLEALREVEMMKKNPTQYKSYTDVDKMMEELLK